MRSNLQKWKEPISSPQKPENRLDHLKLKASVHEKQRPTVYPSTLTNQHTICKQNPCYSPAQFNQSLDTYSLASPSLSGILILSNMGSSVTTNHPSDHASYSLHLPPSAYLLVLIDKTHTPAKVLPSAATHPSSSPKKERVGFHGRNKKQEKLIGRYTATTNIK